MSVKVYIGVTVVVEISLIVIKTLNRLIGNISVKD